MSLSKSQVTTLNRSIVAILQTSDLETVSTKSVRSQLADLIDFDLSPYKKEINALILKQFDLLAGDDNDETEAGDDTHDDNASAPSDPPPSAKVNNKPVSKRPAGAMDSEANNSAPASRKKVKTEKTASTTTAPKSPSTASTTTTTSTTTTKPAPRNQQKQKVKAESMEDEDARLAARLQAEENSRAGRVRQVRERNGERKKAKPRKKTTTPAKVEDGDLESDCEKKEKKRNGGFHKPMALSPALSDLLGGTKTLSRPQTVKMIWEYIRLNGLQDEADKRQIRCDTAMRAVFKTDRVHMFTMNKLLTNNLFPADEA